MEIKVQNLNLKEIFLSRIIPFLQKIQEKIYTFLEIKLKKIIKNLGKNLKIFCNIYFHIIQNYCAQINQPPSQDCTIFVFSTLIKNFSSVLTLPRCSDFKPA
jgi:hypothetical protein